MRRRPSHRSIRSSPERRNNSSEPATSTCSASSTRNSTLNAEERSGSQAATQFLQSQPDATLNRTERQSGCVGDFLVRLTADECAPYQVGLGRRQRIHKAPQELAARGGVYRGGQIRATWVRQSLGEVRHVFVRLTAASSQVVQAAVADHRQQPGATGATCRVETPGPFEKGHEYVLDDVFRVET